MKLSKFLKSLALSAVLCAGLCVAAQERIMSPQERYIGQFAELAVEEMYRSGVPASITLAQGLLESRYGLSELAVNGNNHFGIKCHNTWDGRKIYHDDDRKGECFRKYSSPEESFRDHSDFLRYRDRYKFLFDLETTDYEGWAYGLKKAGYATDPAYPSKLIRLIEEYRLYEYDTLPVDFRDRDRYDDDYDEYYGGYYQDEMPKKKKKNRKDEQEIQEYQTIPESPTKIEAIKLIDESPKGEFRFSLSRQMYSLNGVPFVYSAKGETYADIARTFGLFPKEILKFNDLPHGTDMHRQLTPGTLIYIQPKKNEAARGLEKHVLEAEDNLWAISQRYGVKLAKLYKMNGIDVYYVPREGDIIRLRKSR